MFNKQKLLILTIAGLALAMSGSALADQIDTVDDALYGQPDPYTAVENTTENADRFAADDERIHNELQQASMKQTAGSVDWESVQSNKADSANDGLYSPE